MKLKEEPVLVVNGVALVIALLLYVALVVGLWYANGLTSWADRFTAAVVLLPILSCLAVVEVIAYLVALFLNIRETPHRFWTRKLPTQLYCAWILFGGTTAFVVLTIVIWCASYYI